MAVAPLSDEAARTAAMAELLQLVGPGAVLRASALMSTKPRLPRSYAFRTREGHVGVLQIVQFDDRQHRSLSIRYRIAGPGAAESGAGRSPA
jgi:hypothetical protein